MPRFPRVRRDKPYKSIGARVYALIVERKSTSTCGVRSIRYTHDTIFRRKYYAAFIGADIDYRRESTRGPRRQQV